MCTNSATGAVLKHSAGTKFCGAKGTEMRNFLKRFFCSPLVECRFVVLGYQSLKGRVGFEQSWDRFMFWCVYTKNLFWGELPSARVSWNVGTVKERGYAPLQGLVTTESLPWVEDSASGYFKNWRHHFAPFILSTSNCPTFRPAFVE